MGKDSYVGQGVFLLLGWFLSQVSDMKNEGKRAKEKCLQSLYELEELLSFNRGVCRDGDLSKIKEVIKRLKNERLALEVPSYQLNHCLLQSMEILNQYDPNHQNQAYHLEQTFIRVQMVWNRGCKQIEDDKIVSIQEELMKGFCKRILKWPVFFCKDLWKKKQEKRRLKKEQN